MDYVNDQSKIIINSSDPPNCMRFCAKGEF